MKLSEIELDLKSGLQSGHDPYIQESYYQGMVAIKTFEAIDLILETYANNENESVLDSVVMEAAQQANIPVTKDGAERGSTDATVTAMYALYSNIYEIAKKNKEKLNTCFAELVGIAKNFGISPAAISSGNFVTSFAQPLAKALINNNGDRKLNKKGLRNALIGLPVSGSPFILNRESKKEYFTNGYIEFSGRVFLRSRYAVRIAKDYGDGLAHILAAFGLNIGAAFNDKTLQRFLGFNEQTISGRLVSDILAAFRVDPVVKSKDVKGYSEKAAETTKKMESTINKGAKIIRNDRKLDKNKDYVNRANEEELAEFFVALYAMLCISDAVVELGKTNSDSDLKKHLSDIISATKHDRTRRDLMEDARECFIRVKETSDKILLACVDNTEAIKSVVRG